MPIHKLSGQFSFALVAAEIRVLSHADRVEKGLALVALFDLLGIHGCPDNSANAHWDQLGLQ
jgi:hypothetical protein